MVERGGRGAAIVSAVLVCVLGGQVFAQDSRGSAYDKLDAAQLAQMLREMDMIELLDQLGAELGGGAVDTSEKLSLAIELKIARAQKILDPDARLKAMEEVIALLSGAIEQAEKAPRPGKPEAAAAAVFAEYRMKFRLADTMGREAVEPHAQKVLYLQDNDRDRKIILEKTKQAAELLGYLRSDLKEDIRKWRDILRFWVVDGAEVQRFQRRVRYMSAWTYLYRAMVLSADERRQKEERDELLEEALFSLQPFTKGGPDVGPEQYWSLWLSALANRELGEYDEAARLLAPANYTSAGNELRIKAAMDLTVTHVKRGDFTKALKSITTFQTSAPVLLGQGAQIQIDMRSTLLENYLYLQWAQAAKDAAQKTEYELLAQKAMLGFLNKYPGAGIQSSFARFFSNRYRYRQDIENLNSIQLFLLAKYEVGRKRLQKGAELLKELLSRKDEIGVTVRPPALWEMGMVMNSRRRNIDAGEMFARIATEFPKDPRAAVAADYAARSLRGVIRQRQRDKAEVPRSLREEAARYMALAVGFVGKQPELAQWYYPLGAQCDKLSWGRERKERIGWMEKAVASFEKVPAEPPARRLDAENLALDLRYRLLKAQGADSETVIRLARELRARFMDFSARAAKAAENSANSKMAKRLLDWAAWTDFYAAKIRTEELGQAPEGLEEVKQLPAKWPGAEVLTAAKQFEIQKMVEIGQIDGAGEELDNFLKANPQVTGDLVEQVIGGIRQSIEKLAEKNPRDPKLIIYRSAFLRFAKVLFERVKDKPVQERFDRTILYIEALNQNDRGTEALELVLKGKAVEDARRKKLAEEIDKKYAPKVKAVGRAANDHRALCREADAFIAETRQLGYEPKEDFAQLLAMYSRLKETGADGEEQVRKKWLAGVVRELRDGYVEVIGDLKDSVPVNVNLLLNLARSYRSVNKYEMAVEIYNWLTTRLNTETRQGQGLFWRLELELCRTVLKGFPDDNEWRKTLITRIRQLRMKDALMGGLRRKFFSIEQEAERRSK
ncbi:MAG: hypothetical protein QF577_00615 [Phycisphaerae bacterium]|nr:hypothetical protein [Phycisphaerae bacterium]